jgi:hypothetical protein
MSHLNSNSNWQDATNQLNFAEQTIVQVQKKLASAANDPQQQLWLQQALGAVNHAKDIIGTSLR